MIRDRLVCGVNHDGIQQRLLAEKELKYDKAVELVLAVQAAEKGSQDVKNGGVPSECTCNHTQASGRYLPEKRDDDRSNDCNPHQGIVCYRCGKDHLTSMCTHKETVCHFCKKRGHLACICKAKSRSERMDGSNKSNFVTTGNGEKEDTYSLFKVTKPSSEPITLRLAINNVQVTMEVTQEHPSPLSSRQLTRESNSEARQWSYRSRIFGAAEDLHRRFYRDPGHGVCHGAVCRQGGGPVCVRGARGGTKPDGQRLD